jgi:hypothetical protein
MAARNIYKVIHDLGKWVILRNEEIIGQHTLKENAVESAKDLSYKKISSRVLVYRKDGSIIKNMN